MIKARLIQLEFAKFELNKDLTFRIKGCYSTFDNLVNLTKYVSVSVQTYMATHLSLPCGFRSTPLSINSLHVYGERSRPKNFG